MTHLDMTIQCNGCENEVRGRLHFDDRLKVIDSDGGVLFQEGWCCHNCLGEPWESADATDVVLRRGEDR